MMTMVVSAARSSKRLGRLSQARACPGFFLQTWRLTLSNLLPQEQVDDSVYTNTDGLRRQFTVTPSDTVIRLALELKLAP